MTRRASLIAAAAVVAIALVVGGIWFAGDRRPPADHQPSEPTTTQRRASPDGAGGVPSGAMVQATVKQWNDDEGWGVLTSPAVGGDIWAHYSAVQVDGLRTLHVGDAVRADVVDLGGPIQDGYRYRAERVVPDD